MQRKNPHHDEIESRVVPLLKGSEEIAIDTALDESRGFDAARGELQQVEDEESEQYGTRLEHPAGRMCGLYIVGGLVANGTCAAADRSELRHANHV